MLTPFLWSLLPHLFHFLGFISPFPSLLFFLSPLASIFVLDKYETISNSSSRRFMKWSFYHYCNFIKWIRIYSFPFTFFFCFFSLSLFFALISFHIFSFLLFFLWWPFALGFFLLHWFFPWFFSFFWLFLSVLFCSGLLPLLFLFLWPFLLDFFFFRLFFLWFLLFLSFISFFLFIRI